MSEATRGNRVVQAVKGVVRFLVRLVLLVAFFAAVAAALYYGIPYLERTYLEPLQQTRATVTALQIQLTQQAEDIQATLLGLQNELDALKATAQELTSRMDGLAQRLQALEQGQKELQAQGDAAVQEQRSLRQDLLDLQKQTANLAARLQALDTRLTEWENLWNSQAPALIEARRQILILRLMLHTLRAGLYLSQDNYGTARGEVAMAVDFLQSQIPLLPDAERPQWEAVLRHLRTAQERLPKQPVQAREALDAAWNLLSTLYGSTGTMVTTPTPTPPGTGTPTPTPTP